MHTEEATIYSVILILVLVVAGIIGYYVFNILLAQKREAARRRNYMFSEMVVLENERKRIAHELHDSAGPHLAVLKMYLDGLKDLNAENRDRVKEIKKHVDDILTGIRQSSHALTPTVLERAGLMDALENLAEKLSTPALHITFEGNAEHPVSYDIAIHIYRILEQFIMNTIQHAEASQLKISFAEQAGYYHIRARDNGKGFDMKLLQTNSSRLGLTGFEYRTDLLGGKFDLYTEPGKGVEIKMSIPASTI